MPRYLRAASARRSDSETQWKDNPYQSNSIRKMKY